MCIRDRFFPLHDVRLVAVSDGVDSDEGEDDFTPFKNIMNEYYAKDLSLIHISLDGKPYIVKIKSSFISFKLHNIT